MDDICPNGEPTGQMSSTHWTQSAYDTSTRGTAQQWPIKFKWAGPTKGPQDFAGHNGPAQVKAHKIFVCHNGPAQVKAHKIFARHNGPGQVKAHKIFVDHNGPAQLKAHKISLTIMGRPNCRPTRF